MPWMDTPYQAAVLDAIWGPNRGVLLCATFELGLLTGDPRLGGVEVTGSGYARIACANDASFWLPADPVSLLKKSTVRTFPVPLGLWDVGAWDGIWADVGGVMTLIDAGPLNPVVVADLGDPAPPIQITRRFNSALI